MKNLEFRSVRVKNGKRVPSFPWHVHLAQAADQVFSNAGPHGAEIVDKFDPLAVEVTAGFEAVVVNRCSPPSWVWTAGGSPLMWLAWSRPWLARFAPCLPWRALACVDFVTIFDQATPLELISLIRPDVLVKGGDWKIQSIVGGSFVQAYVGEVKSLQFVTGFSTTSIVEKIHAGTD